MVPLFFVSTFHPSQNMNERKRAQRTAKDFQSWAKSSGKENNWEMIGSGRFSVPHTLRVKPVGMQRTEKSNARSKVQVVSKKLANSRILESSPARAQVAGSSLIVGWCCRASASPL